MRFAGRDRYLDYLRGIAILWVLLFHGTSRLELGFPSLLNFEMPLFFFVSGAGLYLSHRANPDVRRFLVRRLDRLLPAYALLGVVCLAAGLGGGMALERVGAQLVGWALLAPGPVYPGYVTYLWFVPVVLAVSIAHPALVRLFEDPRLRPATLAGLAVAVVAFTVWGPAPGADEQLVNAVPLASLPQYALFYSLFVFLGYFYAGGRLPSAPLTLALAQVGTMAGAVALILTGVVSGSMVANRFPPNLGLACVGVSGIALLLLFRPLVLAFARVVPGVGSALDFFGRHSYSAYLFHGFALVVADVCLGPFGLATGPDFVVPYLAVLVAATALLAWSVDTLLARAAPLLTVRPPSPRQYEPLGR